MSLSQPKALVRKILRTPARFVRREVLPAVIPPAKAKLRSPIKRVRVVGLLSSASGIGQSARLCIDSLRRDGFEISTDDVSGLFGADDNIPFEAAIAKANPDVTIFHLNPPMLLPGIMRSGLSSYYKSYNIGYWAWELETVPPEWAEATRFVDAVMVPSSFCQRAVERATNKPVLLVPHPVQLSKLHERQPRALGDRFRVSTIFNFGSSFVRKNPLALVDAFKRAFGNDATAELVLKTNGGARHASDLAHLRAAIAGVENIKLFDETWSEDRLNDLMNRSDVYASLHRSEGFGLTIADAILRAIPVVATGWSGNMDFCDSSMSDVVDYEMVALSDGHTDYSQALSARWAEPSPEHAALLLRKIRSNYAEAQRRALLVKKHLHKYLASATYTQALATLSAEYPGSKTQSHKSDALVQS